jgi:hypothetical protein
VTTTEKTSEIRPGERRELKSLVKMKIKLLRAEVEEKHAAQMADIEGRVAAKFRDDDRLVAALKQQLSDLTQEMNQRVIDLFATYGDLVEPRSSVFSTPWFNRREDGKDKLRRALVAAVQSQTSAARARLAKLEAELLESLALDAIQSDAAKEFVRSIPTADALMPTEKLAQIEASFGGGEG